MSRPTPQLSALCSLLVMLAACGKDGPADENGETGSPDLVGSVCVVAEDCYPEIDPELLQGEVECLDRVPAGYCTHQCSTNEDCCAAEGECLTDLPQVCSPFESTGLMMCFLSCEAEHVTTAGSADEQAFCQEFVSPWFSCRSSGGGSENEKICVPVDCGVGAACGEDADCGPDLACILEVDAGYCGVRDCSSNADCPADASCITHAGLNYCARNCVAASDCGFCRASEDAAACTSDVAFVEAGTSVCVVG
jgi:hypothetical protein